MRWCPPWFQSMHALPSSVLVAFRDFVVLTFKITIGSITQEMYKKILFDTVVVKQATIFDSQSILGMRKWTICMLGVFVVFVRFSEIRRFLTCTFSSIPLGATQSLSLSTTSKEARRQGCFHRSYSNSNMLMPSLDLFWTQLVGSIGMCGWWKWGVLPSDSELCEIMKPRQKTDGCELYQQLWFISTMSM